MRYTHDQLILRMLIRRYQATILKYPRVALSPNSNFKPNTLALHRIAHLPFNNRSVSDTDLQLYRKLYI